MGIKGLGYYLYIKTFLLMYLRHFNKHCQSLSRSFPALVNPDLWFENVCALMNDSV